MPGDFLIPVDRVEIDPNGARNMEDGMRNLIETGSRNVFPNDSRECSMARAVLAEAFDLTHDDLGESMACLYVAGMSAPVEFDLVEFDAGCCSIAKAGRKGGSFAEIPIAHSCVRLAPTATVPIRVAAILLDTCHLHGRS